MILPVMRQILSVTLLWVTAFASGAVADVSIQPSFGHPYVFAGRIVFTSVDGKHLIGIDKQGHLQWEVAFPARAFLQRSDDQLLVQSGRRVYRLDVSNGTRSLVLRMPKNETLIADLGIDFMAAADSRFDHNRVRVINPADHSSAWESSTMESIVQVTPSTVV